MDFRFPPEDEAFRSEVREFVQREWRNTPNSRYHLDDISICSWHLDDEEALAAANAFAKKLVAKGWYTMHWPKEYGGGEAPLSRRLLYLEEMAYRGAPEALASEGDLFMQHGSPWMKEHFLPRLARADVAIAFGLSEPAAGTDLANVQTQARHEGDYWVLNGQKTWNSTAHRAQWIRVLARTNPSGPKHRGLSMLLVPLDTPGITLRPLYDMLGRRRWSEVFFDTVRVPADHLLGEEDRGWYLTMEALTEDRANIAAAAVLLREWERIADFMRGAGRNDGHPASSARARVRLADLRIAIEAVRTLCYQAAWQQIRYQHVDARASAINYVLTRTLSQALFRTAADLVGPHANILPDAPRWAALDGYLGANALLATGLTIGHGTLNIQKNLIAQRGLGLPR